MTAETGGVREPQASDDQVLAQAVELLHKRPAEALEQARQILKRSPGQPIATLVAGIAQRMLGDASSAVATLEGLVRAQPNAGVTHYEYGLALAAAGHGEAAVAALRRAVALNPGLPGAWRALADHLTAIGDTAAADAAYAQHIRAATHDPRLLRAAKALCGNDIPVAEALLRAHLKEHPTDVAAIRMLAEVAARIGRLGDAQTLLARCLELAPGFAEARAQHATVLDRLNRPLEALREVEQLLALEPRNPNHRNLKATILVGIGEYEQAAEIYRRLTTEYPRQGKVWLSYGHVLKTSGRQAEALNAYRTCLELAPAIGEVWFTLANLKTYRFTREDVTAMSAALAHPDNTDNNRLHLHFALGKACEDAGEFAESFAHYAEGNRLRRAQVPYSADDTTRMVERSRAIFARELFASHAGEGCQAPDPIFVVGLPRSGSTLVEQILASHSQVEGTMELHDMIDLARSLNRSTAGPEAGQYPEVLSSLGPRELRDLGERYLERTRVQRKSAVPHFIDKLPNNFLYAGFIALVLPNARIIDVRRHPLGCCFSGFKQHFARGQHFSYDLGDIGRYYRDYVALMGHFDSVLPGRIHRVHYEALVENTETEVRALLEYCGLPFEDACLRFYENDRAVRTASSEQVRQPIFRDGLEQWRHYEQWLQPLKMALGPALAYPTPAELGKSRVHH